MLEYIISDVAGGLLVYLKKFFESGLLRELERHITIFSEKQKASIHILKQEEIEIDKLREQYREILLFFETLGELFQRMKEANSE